MNPPHFLLDALTDSITSGTFVDTKLYVFSRREASGRVGSPRALYCNSRVLNTVPHFATLFSDGFSEGQTRDINGGFPADSHPYTDDYDYLSDSDLEDEEPQEDGCHDPQQRHEDASDPQTSQTTVSYTPLPRSPTKASEAQNDERPNGGPTRMGKTAIIRDMGAVTCEAMLCFLYTGEIKFAPFRSDPREIPVQAKTGDWSTGRLPSPSAKSIYRLADKYDIPALKEQAGVYIHDNLQNCNIVEEVFSSFSALFPEIMSMQVSRLICKMKEESMGNTEGVITKQLWDKVGTLSQSRLAHATDALAMIWSGMIGPLDPLAPEPKFASSVVPILSPNWHRVRLALLKSISTGAFIDVQFYAYDTIDNGLVLDPRPLFTSSIVIEEWAPAIMTRTVGIDQQAACLADGPTDDYESWHAKLPKDFHNDKTILRYQTEAATPESREVAIVISGAWKTWISLLSYAYTNEMDFSPLQASTRGNGSVLDAEAQQLQLCSPRSVYFLATALGIKNVGEDALKAIQSKLSASNIIQELFSSFTASHKVVLDMEIQFLQERFNEKDPEFPIDHIRRMASGEAPFFATTLSLVYKKLAEKAFPKHASFGSGLDRHTEGQNVTTPTPSPRTSASVSSTTSTSSLQVPTPIPVSAPPIITKSEPVRLVCIECGVSSLLQELHDGLYCPRGLAWTAWGEAWHTKCMRCPLCHVVRGARRDDCLGKECRVRFA